MLIAHAAGQLDATDAGFVHAVALAARAGARLVSIHAGPAADPERLPRAQALLQRWGRAERVQHDWVVEGSELDAPEDVLAVLRRLAPDLLVASTHARSGFGRLFSGSVAEALARNLSVPAVLLPLPGGGFVDPSTGAIELGRLIVPAGTSEDARCGVEHALALSGVAGVSEGEIVVIHAGEPGLMAPSPRVPPGFRVHVRSAELPIESAVAACAQELSPCVIVMATHGHDGLGDVLLGSHTERVLHGARRPLLWVPAQACAAGV